MSDELDLRDEQEETDGLADIGEDDADLGDIPAGAITDDDDADDVDPELLEKSVGDDEFDENAETPVELDPFGFGEIKIDEETGEYVPADEDDEEEPEEEVSDNIF